jgi:hypothetical protein
MAWIFNPFTGELDYYQSGSGSPGPQGVTGANGLPVYVEPELPEDPVMIPGLQGAKGVDGSNGTIGKDGAVLYIEPELPEDVMMIPGVRGQQGAQGVPGVNGVNALQLMLFEPDLLEVDITPGPKGDTGNAGSNGTSGASPITGSYTPGSFTIVDGTFGHMVKRLKLTGVQRGTIQGSGRLSIWN